MKITKTMSDQQNNAMLYFKIQKQKSTMIAYPWLDGIDIKIAYCFSESHDIESTRLRLVYRLSKE